MSDLTPVPTFGTTDPRQVLGSADGWRDVVSKVGQEVAQPLTAALDRVTLLSETGRIDRQSLRALRMEIERARHAAIVGQQLARLSAGELRQSAEHLPLPAMLKDLLALRQVDLQDRGLIVRPLMSPSHVHADAALVFALLNACLDWAIPHASESIDTCLTDVSAGAGAKTRARLTLQFQHRQACAAAGLPAPERVAPQLPLVDVDQALGALPECLADLNWLLLTQTAQASGVQLCGGEDRGRVTLILDFPALSDRPDEPRPDTDLVTGVDAGLYITDMARPVSGSRVLVIADQRAVCMDVREAVQHMSLRVDFVTSVAQAIRYCEAATPDAVIVEASLKDAAFEQLKTTLLLRATPVAFIEVLAQGAERFEVSGSAAHGACVGRDELLQTLPSALAYELSRDR